MLFDLVCLSVTFFKVKSRVALKQNLISCHMAHMVLHTSLMVLCIFSTESIDKHLFGERSQGCKDIKFLISFALF